MDISLLEELHLIETLVEGIEDMVTATIALESASTSQSKLAERARAIREQLQLLSNEISQSINRPT